MFSVRTRLGIALVAIVAAAVLGGLVPHGVTSGVAAMARPAVATLEVPLSVPESCDNAVCGKGSPVPAAPAPAVALVAVAGAAAAAALAAMTVRHRRVHASRLPAGVVAGLFRPPQFS